MKYKIRAQSLPWAIFLMVIISLILTAIISQKQLYSKLSNIQTNRINLIDDIYSGLQYALSSKKEILNDSIKLNSSSFIKISKKNWGFFNCITINGTYNKLCINKEYLSGNVVDSKQIANIVVMQARNRISVTGNTNLHGEIWLPRAQLERSYIERKTYKNKELYKGKLLDVKNYKMKFNNQNIKTILNSINDNIKIGKIFDYSMQFDSIENKFANETIVIRSKKDLVLDQTFIGNIIIRSDSSITITTNCSIGNAILYAPWVKIDDGFNGKLQIFATDSIIIHKNVSLNYPSAICISNSKIKNPFIDIYENCTINGIVLSANYNTKFKNSLIKIRPTSVINGLVYSDSHVDIQGTIFGSLFCKKTILNSNSSYYEDVFVDATIQPYDKCNKILMPIETNHIITEIVLTAL